MPQFEKPSVDDLRAIRVALADIRPRVSIARDAMGRVSGITTQANAVTSASGFANGSNGVVVNVSAVPEPGTSALLALGMLAMVGVRARRVKRVGAG